MLVTAVLAVFFAYQVRDRPLAATRVVAESGAVADRAAAD
jgi:hypothetical protein